MTGLLSQVEFVVYHRLGDGAQPGSKRSEVDVGVSSQPERLGALLPRPVVHQADNAHGLERGARDGTRAQHVDARPALEFVIPRNAAYPYGMRTDEHEVIRVPHCPQTPAQRALTHRPLRVFLPGKSENERRVALVGHPDRNPLVDHLPSLYAWIHRCFTTSSFPIISVKCIAPLRSSAQ